MGFRMNYLQLVAPLLAVMWALSGCEYEWHLSIKNLDEKGNPTFCVSASPGCSRPGVWVSVFDVLEVPPKGTEKPYRTVWSIEPMSKEATLKEVTYGVPPSGYKNGMGPESLRVGQVYQIGGYRFRLSHKENKFTYELGPFDQIQAD